MEAGRPIVRFQPVAQDARRALNEGLRACRSLLAQGDNDRLGNVQIVLAEVINNIVEHAFAGLDPAEARMTIGLEGSLLGIEICDRGRPMPGGVLPRPRRQDLGGDRESLPEGGFGWLLIHELTSDVDYQRVGAENRLRLVFRIGEESPASSLPHD